MGEQVANIDSAVLGDTSFSYRRYHPPPGDGFHCNVVLCRVGHLRLGTAVFGMILSSIDKRVGAPRTTDREDPPSPPAKCRCVKMEVKLHQAVRDSVQESPILDQVRHKSNSMYS